MNWLYYELAGRPQVDEKTPGALNRAVANILHEKYLTPAEVDESDAAWERFEAAQKELLASKLADWQLTKLAAKLFRILHDLRGTAVPKGVRDPYFGGAEDAVSETYLVKRLWHVRLEDLSVTVSELYRNRLSDLQDRLSHKLLLAKTGLRVIRPRANGLRLEWNGPASAPEQAPSNTLEACMRRLTEVLNSGALPANEACQHLEGEGFTTSTIRNARERLGVKIGRQGFGPSSVSVWQLPSK
jgi:hypothetical protein